jgi:CubicO group peptidase (beta-lactamase class C family)
MTSVEQRIDRVVSRLLPETAFNHEYAPTTPLEQRMDFYHTPGVSIAVVDGGEIAWARGFGVRRWGGSEPITERTLFQAASISKPIFGLAVMRLVQEGRLDLDEDINAYLRSWRVPANSGWLPRVTLRQLLSHSAGVTVHGFPGYLRHEPLPTTLQILDGEVPANTRPVRVNIIPGTQFRYSGGGTTVAQQVVVDLLDMPFPAIMRELVLEPLAMRDSSFEQPLPPERHEQAATAHPWYRRLVEGDWHVYPEMAAAGLWTTPSDLAKAGVALQRILGGDTTGILSPETLKEMLTPQPNEEIGIGFFVSGEGEGRRFGHGGWNEGYISEATFYLEGGFGAVVMINANHGVDMVPEIMRAIAKEYDWPRYLGGRAVITLPEEALAAFTGTYRVREGFDCRIELVGNGLLLHAGSQPPFPLQPVSETEFTSPVLNTEVAFTRADDGSVSRLTLRQDGRGIDAEPSP